VLVASLIGLILGAFWFWLYSRPDAPPLHLPKYQGALITGGITGVIQYLGIKRGERRRRRAKAV
jgi:hypothetical protein